MLDVPHFRQRTAWSCGPACVRMVLDYYGKEIAEADLVKMLGAGVGPGCPPKAMIRYFKQRKLQAVHANDLGLNGLRMNIARGWPVIVAYQDHPWKRGKFEHYWDNGHYAVVIDATPDRITICDPSSKRPRRHVTAADFLERWRDITSDGTIFLRWGLAIGPKSPKRR